jgi:hypothetical protein
LEVTHIGRLFIRNLAMCFDNQLAPDGEHRHSRSTSTSIMLELEDSMKTNSRPLAIIAVAGLCAGAAFGQNLLTNGSFELPGDAATTLGWAYFQGGTNAIPGWTTILHGVEYSDPSKSADGKVPTYLGVAQDGAYDVDLAAYTYTGGGLQQAFPTLTGQSYEVSFYMGNLVYGGRDGSGTLTASAGNVTNSYAYTNLGGYMAWSGRSFAFTAVSNLTTLTFHSFDDPYRHFSALDNVSVILRPGTNFSLAIQSYPALRVDGLSGQTYVIRYTQPPATNLVQLQYVTLPTVSNLVFDASSPGGLARTYRAFEWFTNQTVGAEVPVTLAGLAPGLRLAGSAGHTYTLEYNNALATTNWQTLTNVTLETSSALIFDPGALELRSRFYRAVTTF